MFHFGSFVAFMCMHIITSGPLPPRRLSSRRRLMRIITHVYKGWWRRAGWLFLITLMTEKIRKIFMEVNRTSHIEKLGLIGDGNAGALGDAPRRQRGKYTRLYRALDNSHLLQSYIQLKSRDPNASVAKDLLWFLALDGGIFQLVGRHASAIKTDAPMTSACVPWNLTCAQPS